MQIHIILVTGKEIIQIFNNSITETFHSPPPLRHTLYLTKDKGLRVHSRLALSMTIRLRGEA